MEKVWFLYLNTWPHVLYMQIPLLSEILYLFYVYLYTTWNAQRPNDDRFYSTDAIDLSSKRIENNPITFVEKKYTIYFRYL